MIKTGKVIKGETPSEVSGKPSIKIIQGTPLAKGERSPTRTVEKLASQITVDNLKIKR